METYNNNINLTKHPDIINASMKVTQNDKDTNEIVVRVFNNDGTEIDYSGISTAQILFTKPDYRTVQGNMTVRENDLYYKMGTNEIACTGKVVAQVQLLGADGARLTVGGFRFEVLQDPVTPWSVQSTSEYGILQQLVADIEQDLLTRKLNKGERFIIGTSTSGWTAQDCDYLCDGTADDVEIIAALNALPPTGGEVVILDGTYNITASINIPKDNVSIRGNGNATILKRMYDSTNTDSGATAKGLITLRSRTGCKVSDMQIDGNIVDYVSFYNNGIYLDSSSDNTVTGNTCNNNDSDGIYLYSSSDNNTVTGNTCDNNNGSGISLHSSSNNTVTGNTCDNNNGSGISLHSSSNNTVTGNTCDNNDSDGISLLSSSNNTVTGNTCNNNNDSGIYLNSSSNNTVIGNTCNNNDSDGIFVCFVYSSNENTITGNTCNNNGSNGIYLDSSSNNTVTGNTCNNNDSDGIFVYSRWAPSGVNALANENTITGNTCNNNNDSGIYLDSSSNNTVTGNTCNNNDSYGIYLDSSSNNTVTGNTCIRGAGLTSDYNASQHTIQLTGTNNNYNLIAMNNCMGKAVTNGGGTGNTLVNNKFDAT